MGEKAPSRPVESEATTTVDLAAGAEADRANGCRACHGEQGRGDGPLAAGSTDRGVGASLRRVSLAVARRAAMPLDMAVLEL